MKNLSQEEYNNLISGYHACPMGRFKVGYNYTILNPSNHKEKIIARCTQNCPYALIKVS